MTRVQSSALALEWATNYTPLGFHLKFLAWKNSTVAGSVWLSRHRVGEALACSATTVRRTVHSKCDYSGLTMKTPHAFGGRLEERQEYAGFFELSRTGPLFLPGYAFAMFGASKPMVTADAPQCSALVFRGPLVL
jgi:hypothetical protein